MNQSVEKNGLIYSGLSFVIWGLLPMYWKWIDHVNSYEILAHRIIWSFFFMLGLLAVTKSLSKIKTTLVYLINHKKSLVALVSAAILITLNWFLYIYAVNSDHIIQTSLGYYINPLVSVMLGIVFLKEKLSKLEVISLLLAFLGVLIMTISYGQIPWLSLALAISFGIYGLLKKIVKMESSVGLLLETAVTLPLALVYVLWLSSNQASSFLRVDLATTSLLLGAGAVTAIPLLCFAIGAQRIPLYLVGFLQYIAPTFMLILGVFMYGEAFSSTEQVSFAFIWGALAIFTLSKMKKPNKFKPKKQPLQV